MNNKILVAEILGSKGLKGEVKLKSYTEHPLAIETYSLVDNLNVSYKIESAYLYKDTVVAKLNNINTKTETESVIGKKLYVYRESFPNLTDNNFYIVDLVGLVLLDLQNNTIGSVVAAYNFGAGDILEVKDVNNKSFMMPFNEETITTVNINNKQIVVSDSYKEYM